MQTIFEKYHDQGLIILGLATENAEAGKSFRDEFKLTYPLLVEADKSFQDYGITGIPCTYFVDRTGKVRHRELGFGEGSEKIIEEKVQELLKEK